ncbi:MAG: hypothetical protein ACXAAH_06610 [Promethearchaeota archaeon]|jgi:hypothetical protein
MMDISEDLNRATQKMRRIRFKDNEQFSLGQLITECENISKDHDDEEEDLKVQYDFGYFQPDSIDSWRGSYDELALSYVDGIDINVKSLDLKKFIEILKEADGKTYMGYKGGDFTMNRETPVWVDNYSHSSETAVVGLIDLGWKVIIETKHMEY